MKKKTVLTTRAAHLKVNMKKLYGTTQDKVKVREGYCPVCGAEIEYSDSELTNGLMRYRVDCDCGFVGYEDYKLEFIGFWDNKNDKEIPVNKRKG